MTTELPSPDGTSPTQGEPTDSIAAEGFLDGFGPVRRFDRAVDDAFDRLRGHPVADRVFYSVTELGDFGLVWLLIGAARALRNDDNTEEFVRLAVTMGAESVVVNGIIKNLIKRERPVVDTPRPHNLRIPITTSFPSGHASSAMTAAVLLGQGRRHAPLYYALGLAVASSRIYVRIHHASDVVGGLAVGLVLGRVARRLWPGPKGR